MRSRFFSVCCVAETGLSPPAPSHSRHHGLLLCGAPTGLVKLWLVRGQAIYAIGPADHDDRLFLQLAEVSPTVIGSVPTTN